MMAIGTDVADYCEQELDKFADNPFVFDYILSIADRCVDIACTVPMNSFNATGYNAPEFQIKLRELWNEAKAMLANDEKFPEVEEMILHIYNMCNNTYNYNEKSKTTVI